MNDIDDLLARSAPPSTPEGPALEAVLAALVDEARGLSAPPRRRRRRALWAGAAAAIVGVGGATAYATGALSSDAWGQLTDDAEAEAVRIEWLTTLPDGTTCVERLTGIGLDDAQVAAIATALADSERLLELDGGAVRGEFLSRYDGDADLQAMADRDTWAGWIDAAYAAVAEMDVPAGRGGLPDDELGVVPPGVGNEVFLHASMRIVLDGLTAQGIDAMALVTPETACEAGA
ncbi:hypothetical protein [Demequina iriomotensis]|uniref:hypothetical protein n=1 Tax=Demequina iriomotensis TaxID=1536641 RepID=UPI0007861A86|nr:hypothetical protein [Demequina iriomotensis]